MRPYADTNFFTRRLLPLPGNEAAAALASEGARAGMERLPVTWLLEIELANAIEHCVFTSRTSGQFRVSPEAAGAAHALFAEDLARADFLIAAPLDVNDLKDTARELALRHTARSGFRTYDLLHVAAALLLGCDTVWSFDVKARSLARAEGLAVNSLGDY